jgi:hypothetical protein
MTERLSFLASEIHFARHLAPVYLALPDDLRGEFVCPPPIARQMPFTTGRNKIPSGPVAVASWGDLRKVRMTRQPVAFFEHGTGQTYCLAPWTKVLTDDLRWVQIDSLEVGDGLFAFEEHQTDRPWRGWQHATVTGVSRLTLPCYRLTMSDGTELVASETHRWLRRKNDSYGWMETERLAPADVRPQRSSKLLKLFDVWETDNSWGGGYIAAAFDGEGSLTQQPRENRQNRLMLSFTQKDNAMLTMMVRLLGDRGFEFSIDDREDGVQHLRVLGGTRDIIRLLGEIRPRRLLDNFKPLTNGQMRGKPVEVIHKEFIGDHPVVGIETTTGTYIAEGFASHNSRRHTSYAGGPGRERVGLFVCQSARVAAINEHFWPGRRYIIAGVPYLDDRHRNRRGRTGRTAVVAFHWDATWATETRWAWPHFRDGLAAAFDGWDLYGHAHPRAADTLSRWFESVGIRWIDTFDRVLDVADLFVVDNSSTLYEAASVGIPVVALNAPWYRRELELGLRFWSRVPGPQADDVTQIPAAIAAALTPQWQARREQVVDDVYACRDGSAAATAVAGIVEWAHDGYPITRTPMPEDRSSHDPFAPKIRSGGENLAKPGRAVVPNVRSASATTVTEPVAVQVDGPLPDEAYDVVDWIQLADDADKPDRARQALEGEMSRPPTRRRVSVLAAAAGVLGRDHVTQLLEASESSESDTETAERADSDGEAAQTGG